MQYVGRTVVVAIFLAAVVAVGCGGGSSSKKKSPFPPAVRDLFDDVKTDLRAGVAVFSMTCGATPIDNPFERDIDSQSIPISASGDAHSGTVADVRADSNETRNTDGSGTFFYTIRDESNMSRQFLDFVGTFGAPTIRFLAPPFGARDFLAPSGTGQSFAVVTIERKINWTRNFTNDPAPTATTLVDFTGITIEPDGMSTGTVREKLTLLIEFDITAGPGGNVACIVDVVQTGAAESSVRNGSGSSVSLLRHDHGAHTENVSAVQTAAFENASGVAVAVGFDPIPFNAVTDGDALFVTGGRILGGVSGLPSFLNESRIDDADNAFLLVNDGVFPITDGDFDGVTMYDVEGTLDLANVLPPPSPPRLQGAVNNGTVDFTVLTVDTAQLENPILAALMHPVLDEFLLYGANFADTETGIIIFF
ncbi:MAG: hypothetical protein O7H41_18690 [Planctomycetota bacterium]|nr:hypothetical protein [Planctomycetota bacterium]